MLTVETEGIRKSFASRTALNEVSIAVPTGTVHGLLGTNGAGKTTLLKLCLGLYRPDAGSIRVFGQLLGRESASERADVRYVGADAGFPEAFRGEDLLRYGRLLYETWDDQRVRVLQQVLALPLDAPIRTLSFGRTMQLRLLYALASRPKLLLLDEPTTGLDIVARQQMLQLIAQEAAVQGVTVMYATHQLVDLERLADDITVLHEGHVVAAGAVETLRSNTHHVQAVIPELAAVDELKTWPSVLHFERRGMMVALTVEGDPAVVEAALVTAGATFVERLPVDLETWLTGVFAKAGYQRSGVVLP